MDFYSLWFPSLDTTSKHISRFEKNFTGPRDEWQTRGIRSTLSWKTETTLHCCWRLKSSLKLVWMESTSPCNSLIGHSLKWRCMLIVLTHISFDKNLFWPFRKRSVVCFDCQLCSLFSSTMPLSIIEFHICLQKSIACWSASWLRAGARWSKRYKQVNTYYIYVL